ncbi:hypothetical protein F511_42318 [Dorcoceras hygrometricum]|uniref:Zinc finger, CCHC-type n=1 Tax=Dorcoceras hygrometricum TaxID=472368 RepID=A0A2Z6ZZE3_9LAMI|nr:hypothetical protein F511_42318 [Dorcoceras hygrometricum]
MLFNLTTFNLVRFLREDVPTVAENETDKEKMTAFKAWRHGDFLCRNYVLKGLDNSLYKVYDPMTTAKLLWESLERKYKLKKFILGKFLDYKMMDSKSVMSQVQEMQLILHDLHVEGNEMSESFQVAEIIEKLPPLWKDFKNYLKHKCKGMGLEDLIVNFTLRRIAESNPNLKGTKAYGRRIKLG